MTTTGERCLSSSTITGSTLQEANGNHQNLQSVHQLAQEKVILKILRLIKSPADERRTFEWRPGKIHHEDSGNGVCRPFVL